MFAGIIIFNMKKIFNLKKGFTLIELLVVIAIVGILAGITLSVLSSARTRARDTSVKGMMDQMRKQGEIFYSINGHYGKAANGFCIQKNLPPSDPNNTFSKELDEGIGIILAEILNAIPDPQVVSGINGNIPVACYSRPSGSLQSQSWAVRIGLPSRTPWCADSVGHNGPGVIATTNSEVHCAQ